MKNRKWRRDKSRDKEFAAFEKEMKAKAAEFAAMDSAQQMKKLDGMAAVLRQAYGDLVEKDKIIEADKKAMKGESAQANLEAAFEANHRVSESILLLRYLLDVEYEYWVQEYFPGGLPLFESYMGLYEAYTAMTDSWRKESKQPPRGRF